MRVSRWQKRSAGIVSLDVLWIVLLLGMVVLLSWRGIGLEDRRERAERLERELLLVGKAVERLAEERGLEAGDRVMFADYAEFIDKAAPKRLRENGQDPLGKAYGEQVVGEGAIPNGESVRELGKFWK